MKKNTTKRTPKSTAKNAAVKDMKKEGIVNLLETNKRYVKD